MANKPSANRTSTKDTTAEPENADRKAKRRARLRSLMSGRKTAVADLTGGDAEATGLDGAASRKAIARIYRVLTDTPADDKGMVEGTPFTQAGVIRLMETLKARAANEEQAGAKIATRMLKVLTPKEGESDVHGVSLDRLQRIAKAAEKQGKSGRKAGKRRAN